MQRQKYLFNGERKDCEKFLGLGGTPRGFRFEGDAQKPKGLYAMDGTFYGDDGKFSECELISDLIEKAQLKLTRSKIGLVELMSTGAGR